MATENTPTPQTAVTQAIADMDQILEDQAASEPPVEEDPFAPEYTLEDLEAYFEGRTTEDPPAADDAAGTPPASDEGHGAGGEGGESGDSVPAGEPAPLDHDQQAEPPAEPTSQQGQPDEPATTPLSTPDMIRVGDRLVPRSELEALLDWTTSLTPAQLEAINHALAQPSVQPEPPTPAETPAEPEPEPQPAPELDEELRDDPLARYIDARFGQIEERFGQQLSQLTQAQQEQLAREQAAAQAVHQRQIEEAVSAARRGVRDRFGLTDDELALLEKRTEDSGEVLLLAQQAAAYGQTVATPDLFERAMENTYWKDPQFREREINRRIMHARAEASHSTQLAERKANASALAGTGAAAPRQTAPANPAEMTEQERHDAMVDEIAQEMWQRQSGIPYTGV